MLRPERLRRLAVTILPLMLTGCFGVSDQHSTLVKTVPADLAFGDEPSPAPAAAPSGAPSAQGGVSLPTFLNPVALIAGLATPAPLPTFAPLPSAASGPPCPATVLPGIPAVDPILSGDVDGKPTAGTYRVRTNSNLVIDIPGVVTAKVPYVASALPRTVRNVSPVTDPANSGEFSYTVDGGLALGIRDSTSTTSFLAKPNRTDTVVQTVPLPHPGPPPSPAPQPPNVGTSLDGLYLTHLTAGVLTASLTPVTPSISFTAPAGAGVLVFQAPASNGLQWKSSATDPASGTTISFEGGINPTADPARTGREVVNACGEPVEAWAVDGTLTITGPGIAITDTVHLDVASQYGGFVIADSHTFTHAVVGANQLDGQVMNATLDHRLADGQHAVARAS